MPHDEKELNDMMRHAQEHQQKEAEKLLNNANRQEELLRQEVDAKLAQKEAIKREGARAYLRRKLQEELLKRENQQQEQQFKQKQARAYLIRKKGIQK